jgi:hypothetical protein
MSTAAAHQHQHCWPGFAPVAPVSLPTPVRTALITAQVHLLGSLQGTITQPGTTIKKRLARHMASTPDGPPTHVPARPSPPSPTTPACSPPGPPPSTQTPADAGKATRTPPVSSPAHGSASYGPAGTTPPLTIVTPRRTTPHSQLPWLSGLERAVCRQRFKILERLRLGTR